jgi:hypothetical protein
MHFRLNLQSLDSQSLDSQEGFCSQETMPGRRALMLSFPPGVYAGLPADSPEIKGVAEAVLVSRSVA